MVAFGYNILHRVERCHVINNLFDIDNYSSIVPFKLFNKQ